MKHIISIPVLLLVLLSSCVSSKKYDSLALAKDQLDREYKALLGVRDEKAELEAARRNLQQDLVVCKEEMTRQQELIQGLESARDDLNQRLNDLIAQNQALLTASSEEKQQLVEEILAKEAEINRKTADQESLAKALAKREADAKELAADLAEKEKRIAELNGLLDEREKALSTLKTGLLDALRGYSSADLSVREENGRVYVSMSQNLLFPSGSDIVDPKGVQALRQLAGVLKVQKDVEILVEGHTDTDGSADLNWDLSVKRASSVVKILTKEGVPPEMVSAAGRAFYLPLASNDTVEGKARNRRVEIILAPQLEKILQMIGSGK
ncbi:MAG: OmpA family protein [Saprospiraceae bacterium]